ncbi:MAG: hypothetical protein WA635_11015 [Gallionella sp.]
MSAYAELMAGDGQCKLLQGIAIATRPPGVNQLVSVRIKLVTVRCRADRAPLKQYLESLGGSHTGTQLAGHGG